MSALGTDNELLWPAVNRLGRNVAQNLYQPRQFSPYHCLWASYQLGMTYDIGHMSLTAGIEGF